MTAATATASYREAMACLGAAVNVVTSAGDAGRVGFTATAVCSVTDQPPTLLVCMNRKSEQNEIVKRNGVLCVNTLAADQQELSAVFAGFTSLRCEDRFAASSWTTLKTGAPLLTGALASFDCAVESVVEAGTHSIFLCNVAGVVIGGGEGLVYFRRDYHSLLKPNAST
jgi:flavin reductase